MRATERIPIIIEFFKSNVDILGKFLGQPDIENMQYIDDNWNEIQNDWEINYDYRFGQLLINLGIIPDNRMWYVEEVDWLIEKGHFKFEELHFWRSILDKDNNPLPEPINKPLSKLETSHIENVIKHSEDNKYTINPQYLEYFKQRINHAKI